jgi:hypothetical protein
MSLNLIPIDIPAGLNADDTAYAASAAWDDCNNVRFRLGRPQVIGGWEGLTLSALSGVCRTVFGWTENNTNVLDVAFGKHNGLQLAQGGTLYDVTPTLALPSVALGANPLSVTSGSATVVVSQAGHPYTTGEVISLAGAAAVGGITPAGAVTVTATTSSTWSFAWTSGASATASGGGSAVVATPQRGWTGGAVDGAGSAGFGTGSYGGGAFGAPSTTDFFALTWSLAAWGQKLIANPRNQTLHIWGNDTAARAQPIRNAPARATYALVAPQRQVFALGCSQEVDGVFNPLCIRHSSVGDETSWSTVSSSASTAREYVLPGGGRIVAGRVAGRFLLVWTNHALWLGTYYGQVGKVWSFDKVGDKCGLIGPNAAVVLGSTAYWISPDRQFHAYSLGGVVQSLPCPIRKDFADNLAPSQADKIVASSIAEFGEIRFDYPDARDGFENSRYLAACVEGPDAGAWYRGTMARTAMVDAGPHSFPIGVSYAGKVYWHEKGASADGAPLAWSLSTAALFLDENRTALARKFLPDTGDDQKGAVRLSISTYMAPNDRSPRTFGPYVIAADQTEVDIMAEGRLFQLDFSGESAPAFMRLGRLLFDAKARGRR